MTTQQQSARYDDVVASPRAERACADWLALRREADTVARDAGAGPLLEQLVEHLHGREPAAVRVVDVGAGTGANQAYLSSRLPFEQAWVVVDHDADLLAHAGHGDAVRVEAGVCDLVDVVEELAVEYGSRVPLVLTCTALLDVLTGEELGCLADVVERSAAPALLSLSVTGQVDWTPRDRLDELVGAAFDDHQRRDGRAGPEAVTVLREDLSTRGLRVVTARTPWVLDARDPDLLGRWLDERVEAAAEQRPELAEPFEEWCRRRHAQLRAGHLTARVHHEDLLVLPAGALTATSGRSATSLPSA